MARALVGLDEIVAARDRIGNRVHRTPIHGSRALGDRFDLRLSFKAELFQKTGSFKIRGVVNKLLSLPEEKRARGLISISAGNHAAALAYGASLVGAPATIVMPSGAVPSKISATRGYGGEVLLTDDDLLATMRAVEEGRGLTFVHPFDDPAIIAGHATLGLEIAEDVPDLDAVIVPVGGGGLISGVAAAIRSSRPDVKLFGVEPIGANVMTRSLAEGRPVHAEKLDTIADGLAAPFVGEHNLRHVRALVDEVVTVRDESIVEALGLVWTRTKLAAEPSAVAGIAALLEGSLSFPPGTRVTCVLSGGNVDRDVLRGLRII